MTDPTQQPPPSLFSPTAVRLALETPWKARNEIERLLLIPLAWIGLRFAGVDVAPGWKFYGLPIIQKQRSSILQIGRNLNLRSHVRSNPLGPNHACILSTRRPAAKLVIGDDFGMTGGAIVCEERITIGDRVTVGANTVIADTDFHPLDPVRRYVAPLDGATRPVNIEDDVFIGMQCLILKGVTIGRGSVIGAGSVVTRDIPPNSIAAGNPARVLKSLQLPRSGA
jgi:acetyltransferase-like isoleucine patch superfamily enzyme